MNFVNIQEREIIMTRMNPNLCNCSYCFCNNPQAPGIFDCQNCFDGVHEGPLRQNGHDPCSIQEYGRIVDSYIRRDD